MPSNLWPSDLHEPQQINAAPKARKKMLDMQPNDAIFMANRTQFNCAILNALFRSKRCHIKKSIEITNVLYVKHIEKLYYVQWMCFLHSKLKTKHKAVLAEWYFGFSIRFKFKTPNNLYIHFKLKFSMNVIFCVSMDVNSLTEIVNDLIWVQYARQNSIKPGKETNTSCSSLK